MPAKSRSLSSTELGIVTDEIRKKIESAFFKNFYEPREDSFLLTFSKERKETAVYIGLAKTINETEFKEKTEAPTDFALKVRKRLEGTKVEKVEQHGTDRILVITFSGREKYSVIVEMFDKGNLLLVNKENLIELAYTSRSFKERSLRRGMLYSFPLERGRISAGREKPERIEPRLYEKEGELVEFSATPIEKYERDSSLKTEKFATLSALLDRLYLKERSSEINTKKSREIEALNSSIAKLRKQIEDTDLKSEEYKNMANKIFSNMHEINGLLNHMKQNKVRNVEELGRSFGNIKVKGVDPKRKIVKIELD